MEIEKEVDFRHPHTFARQRLARGENFPVHKNIQRPQMAKTTQRTWYEKKAKNVKIKHKEGYYCVRWIQVSENLATIYPARGIVRLQMPLLNRCADLKLLNVVGFVLAQTPLSFVSWRPLVTKRDGISISIIDILYKKCPNARQPVKVLNQLHDRESKMFWSLG